MIYSKHPKSDKEAILYAKHLSEESGKKHIPIRLADGNPWGLTRGAVLASELPDYIAGGSHSLEDHPTA